MKKQGEWEGGKGKREIGEEEEEERARTSRQTEQQEMGLKWKKTKIQQLLQLRRSFFCFVSLVMDSQSHLLLLSV